MENRNKLGTYMGWAGWAGGGGGGGVGRGDGVVVAAGLVCIVGRGLLRDGGGH